MSGEMDRRVDAMEGLNAKQNKKQVEPTLGRTSLNNEKPKDAAKGDTP
jgi:hypothetical protein